MIPQKAKYVFSAIFLCLLAPTPAITRAGADATRRAAFVMP